MVIYITFCPTQACTTPPSTSRFIHPHHYVPPLWTRLLTTTTYFPPRPASSAWSWHPEFLSSKVTAGRLSKSRIGPLWTPVQISASREISTYLPMLSTFPCSPSRSPSTETSQRWMTAALRRAISLSPSPTVPSTGNSDITPQTSLKLLSPLRRSLVPVTSLHHRL
jgi:hypothetical protein